MVLKIQLKPLKLQEITRGHFPLALYHITRKFGIICFRTAPQQLVNGIILGSIYALLALGYTMVYGIIKLINFAHGDIYMLGAFIGYYAISSLHMNFWIALILQ